MLELAKQDHHTAFLRDDGIIVICNPRGIIGEFSQTGDVVGLWRPQSRREQDTAKTLVSTVVHQLAVKGVKESQMYPKTVKPADVVNGSFAPGLFRIKGGRALYDEVYMADGGQAVYLAKIEPTDEGLKVIKRWIKWDTELEQMFEAEY